MLKQTATNEFDKMVFKMMKISENMRQWY
jgi:hypothetical protein